MLDIKFIKENKELIKENIKKRNVKVDIEFLIEIYDNKNEIKKELDNLRHKRNENASKMKQKLSEGEREILIEEGKNLKNKISELEEKEREIEKKFLEELYKVPNLTHPTTPIGNTDKDSLEIKKSGKIREFDFKPKDHIELGEILDIVDFENASIVTGQKFYYLKNEGVLLELALINFAIKKLMSKGFVPYITPDLAKSSIVEGIGFNPRGEETNIYSILRSDLCLIGTSEITLGGLYVNKILHNYELPIKMVGFSHCFRTEAGAAGLATKGLYRVHQFSKVEMFIFCKPEESERFHNELREIEEEIYDELEIPYRVLDIASGDLGNPAYKKYDLEAWMPGRNDYGEITSTSNCTDFQARRLNIRFKDEEGSNIFIHMLNGTAIAVPRVIIAILENFQNKDQSVDIPQALRPFIGIEKIIPKEKK